MAIETTLVTLDADDPHRVNLVHCPDSETIFFMRSSGGVFSARSSGLAGYVPSESLGYIIAVFKGRLAADEVRDRLRGSPFGDEDMAYVEREALDRKPEADMFVSPKKRRRS